MVSKCYYFVTGLLVGERQIPLGLILCLSNTFHVHICGTRVYRCVCPVRGTCDCVYIYIWGPEVGIMGFFWSFSTLFFETEPLNWSQSSPVLAGFTNQLASGTLSLPCKCWVYRQATHLRGTSVGSGDLPSTSSACTASALSAEPSPHPVFSSKHFLPWGFHCLCQNWGWSPKNLLPPNDFLMFLIVSYNHTKVIDLGSIWKLLSFLRGRNWHFPNQYLLLRPGCCSAYIFGRLKIIPHQEVLSTWPSPLLWRCAHSSNLHREQQIKWRDMAVRVIFPP